MKSILIFISCFLLVSCNYMSERKKHRHIIDSLSKIDVPKYFDTLRFMQQAGGFTVDSMTPEGIHIEQYMSYMYAYRMDVHYPDSLYRDVYEYDEKGRIVEHFQELGCYYCGGRHAIGYRTKYDTLGNVCGYERDIPEAPFNIYEILELLQKENVNIVDSSFIGYRDYDWDGFSNYWHVTVYYNRYKYGHTRYFDPQTGKILKEWIQQYEHAYSNEENIISCTPVVRVK